MRLTFFCKTLILELGMLLFFFNGFSSEQEKYLHFTEIDGLPRNIAISLEQDDYGYLWIGTTNGLARYDGKSFNTYKELTGIKINYIFYDSKKTLWVAAGNGLYKYDRVTNFFNLVFQGFITKIREDQGSVYFLMVSSIFRIEGDKYINIYQGSDISDFCFSKQGIWLAKTKGGIWLLSRNSDYKVVAAKYLNNSPVSTLQMIDEKLVAGCYNGHLFYLVPNGEPVQVKINNHHFFGKITKVDQEIWLATDGNGIIILDKNLQFSRTLNRDKNTNASLNSNSIHDILPGNNHEIWIASHGAGITCILPDNLLFQNILPEKGNENSLVANEGISMFIKGPLIYFGTNYGLSVWDEKNRKFRNLHSDRIVKDLKGSKITALSVDQDNNILLGTYDGLMGKYSPDFKLLDSYHPSSETPDEMQQIIQLHEINKNNILILTQFFERILINYDLTKKTGHVFELYNKGSKITYDVFSSLRVNRNGELLAIICNKGLFHVNWKNNVLENRLSKMNQEIKDFIQDFYQDKLGDYWFASSAGLIHISKEGTNYRKYTVKDGLISNNLVRIESVDDRFLWIGTVSGICRFDMLTSEVLNFNHNHGLPANEFLERGSVKTSDGRIIFGSSAGFTIVNPSKVSRDSIGTKVIISDITFQNQSIRQHEGKQYLDKPLEEATEIWLPFSKNSFSIHFFAKNRSYQKYHNYAYRLSGLEKDWTYLSETNYVNYTNLFPGKYTFEIKTSDKLHEGKPTLLIIHIRAPWYLSWYAYLFYAVIFFIMLYLFFYGYSKRLELRKEKEISDFKIKKEHELTEKKLAFFTNVSHDLKTPLTLIDAPVNDLLQSDNLRQEQVNKLMIINRNSKRLYKLITDLLDFRKITQKEYVLRVRKTAVSDVISEVAEAFKEECRYKSIELRYNVEPNLIGYIDAEKIEKVIWNLLSNSLKFTQSGGFISLSAEELIIDNKKHLKLIVADNGIGITEKDKSKIFNQFYKAKNSLDVNKEGTGIGLSIVKELVEMHHGTVQVDSEMGSGAMFTVIVPSEKESYPDNELEIAEKQEYSISKVESSIDLESIQQPDGKKQYNLRSILVVEDNAELREYLAEHFEKSYKVFTAEEGAEGLKCAREISPDIILTDVQMPVMDGYEFCRELRRNFDTSHIPVVMLTANNTIEHQVEGLSTGADVYMTKPFDIKLLDAQINSLVENRRTLRNRFQKLETPENLENSLPQKDIDFILELKLFIQENMMNQDLGVDLLSEHFAVSLAQLHRKIKSLTGSTPNNLIKSIRLKRAYQLIRENGLRVSEAAYQTGFSDPNYFTICFKKEFGENPSQIVGSVKEPVNIASVETQKPETTLEAAGKEKTVDNLENSRLPLLLIAEDNEEMRNYISDEFSHQYRTIVADDGNAAYRAATDEIPDIIISDIMMPGMDGLELCRKLKTDERTCHIPILMLTARNSEENTLEGLENGADDYITKPFNTPILMARVHNLLQSRLLLRKKFLKEPDASVKEISPSVPDEKFLKKAYEVVEKHMMDLEFDVHLFSSELGMSRAQLYRKIDAVSGQSVHEFIRIVRLKKAAELLSKSDVPISEVVEKVGFNSFAYFTKSFREYFGVTPSQYKK